ncbi:MAG: SH3 domain-containing protein, partial [Clostridia bacterium]|nr:SH3 domain-containing protein [Clostridia bacterium]
REGPSTSSRIITSFPIDTAVTVTQKGSGWHKVKVGEQEGYMSSRYLVGSKAPAYTKPLETPVPATMKNINGGSVVNFRLYPGMKTKIIKAYPVGTQVTVLEKGELWCKVEIEGRQGYVSTYMLKF